MKKDKKFWELASLIGQEAAESLLKGAEDLGWELKEAGVAFKSLSDITDQLNDLSVAELHKLRDSIMKLLSQQEEHETPSYVEDRPKKKEYTSPLDKDLQEGIENILSTRRETKQKATSRGFFERGHKVSDDIDEIVHTRNTKGKGGRWSGPPIELTGQASIEAILRWREEHGLRG